MHSPDLDALRARVAANFEAALGRTWRAQVARALDMKPPNISRMFSPPQGRTDHPSAAMEALAEFLASTPRKHWPTRWLG